MPKFNWDDLPDAAPAPQAPAQAPKQGAKFNWDDVPDAPTVPPAQRGKQVYDEPAGPEQASAVDRFIERVKDPERLRAVLVGQGPYASKAIQGDMPMVMPGGAIPKLTQAAVALADGQGLGYALGRTALSAGQGAVMSAGGGKEGESFSDKLKRIKDGATLSGGIQLAAESIPIVGKALGYAGRKIGSALSGLDESVIQNYATRTDEVNKLIRQSGGDVTTAADQVRTELSNGIQSAKSKLNSQITSTLEQAPKDEVHSIQPILDKLNDAKAKLNPVYKADAISEIDDMIGNISKNAEDGKVDLQGLYETKQFLGENAKSAYNKGGQIFTRASEAARAAKDAGSEARGMLKPVAGDISEADAQLSRLHAIEGRLNKNLLAPGKPDGALLAAGSGANARNAANLRALEEVSGVPVAQRAKDLATAKDFSNPSLLPSGSTGKVAARMAAGAGVGYLADGRDGAVIGGALASPMALKVGINAANVASKMASRIPSFAQLVRENPVASQAVVQLVSGQIRRANDPSPEITPDVEQYFKENPKLLQDIQDPKAKADIQARIQPLKGEDKWAKSGIQKLGIQDADAATLMQSKEAKRLLIEASDLSPGSPRLKRIMEQIQTIQKGQTQ